MIILTKFEIDFNRISSTTRKTKNYLNKIKILKMILILKNFMKN